MRHLRSCSAVLAALLLSACSAAPAPAPETESSAPSIANEREIVMDGLAGTFRNAGEGAPAVLIVPGSGPTDRDGNNPMGVSASTYRMLANDLAARGISTLRIDKRGLFGSDAAGDPNAVTVPIYARDYIDWAAQLRAETGRDCVYLMGHSEGGMMVSAAGVQDAGGICGLVLLAAPGRPMGDILREQLRANPANKPILKSALGAIDRLEAGERVDVSAMHAALQGLFAPAVQDFLISAFATDPAALLREAALPTLIIQGEHDLQVGLDDARALEAAGGTLVVLPGVNHVLKTAPKGRRRNFATYSDPDLPLAAGVVPAIADFIAVQ